MLRVFETDVLILGGGIAAQSAAIHATKSGVKVLLVNKGLLGKQSCSVCSAFWSNVYEEPPPDTPETHWKRRVASGPRGSTLSNQELTKIVFFEGYEASRELEEMGMYWRRTDEGKLMYICPIGKGETVGLTPERAKELGYPILEDQGNGILPTSLFEPRFGGTGHRVTATLRDEVVRLGIEYMEDTVGFRLLTTDGVAVGVAAYDLRRGDLIVVNAKSTILACGGVGMIVPYITCTREMACDGYMMAYNAGAELMNVSVGQGWHHADVGCAAEGTQWPDSWYRLQFYPYCIPMSQDHPYFRNKKGERFMKELEVAAPYEARACATAFQTRWGLAPLKWGAYCDVRHWDMKVAPDVWTQWDYVKKMGLDPAKDLLETGMSYHWNQGGVRVNLKMESSIPGLYVAGGNAAGGGTQVGAYVTGKLAAEHASKRAATAQMLKLDWSQVEEETKRINHLRTLADKKEGPTPIQVKRILRDVMWEKMHFIKHEKTMMETLEEITKIRQDILPTMRLDSDTEVWNYDLVEAIDLTVFMLDYCDLYTRGCLFRTESRGPFFREDYPAPDNKNWLKHTVFRKVNDKLELSTVPHEQPLWKMVPELDRWDMEQGRWRWVSLER